MITYFYVISLLELPLQGLQINGARGPHEMGSKSVTGDGGRTPAAAKA